MRAANALVAVAAVAGAGLIRRDGTPSCAESCFQRAVNYWACEDWLADEKCCGTDQFLLWIAYCIYDPCSSDDAIEAWKQVQNECAKVRFEVYSYESVKSLGFEYYEPSGMTTPYSPDNTGEPESTETTETTETAESTSETTTSETSTETTESESEPTSPSTTVVLVISTLPPDTSDPPATSDLPSSTRASYTGTDYPFPGDSIPLEDNITKHNGDGLATGEIAAISIVVSLVGVGLLIWLFYWCQRRKKKYSPANTAESTDGMDTTDATDVTDATETKEAPEIQDETPQIVYEIYGTEVNRDGSEQPLELEGTPAPPKLDGRSSVTPRISSFEPFGGSLELEGDGLSTSPARHQRTDSSSRLSEPRRHSNAESSFSPVSPPTSPGLPLTAMNLSPLSGPLDAPNSDQNHELTDLLSDLAVVERQRKERAAQLRSLQEQEMAIRAEEEAILERIRKRASMMPERDGSPGPGPGPGPSGHAAR